MEEFLQQNYNNNSNKDVNILISHLLYLLT